MLTNVCSGNHWDRHFFVTISERNESFLKDICRNISLFKPNLFTVIISYVVPLIVVMFISILSLLLDYRYVVKKENDDGVILKQRIITYVPMLLSLLVVFFVAAALVSCGGTNTGNQGGNCRGKRA